MIAGSSIFLGRFFLNPCCVRSTVLFDEQYWFFECAFFCCGPSVSITLSGLGVCCLCVCLFWKGSFNSLLVAFFLLAFCFFSCDRLLVIEVAPALISSCMLALCWLPAFLLRSQCALLPDYYCEFFCTPPPLWISCGGLVNSAIACCPIDNLCFSRFGIAVRRRSRRNCA